MSDRPAETEYSALQALLQIRTNTGEGNAFGEAADGLNVGNDAASATSNASQAATINANAKIANLLRMGASPAAILQHAQMTYPPAQLAAIRATAAASLPNQVLQAAALQNPTFTGNTHATHSPFLQAMARDPTLVAATVATAPMSPALDLPRSPVLSPLRPAAARGLSQGGAISPAGQSVDSSVRNETQEEKKIRKDEVEAALRSKPQRGRKRENLNAEERLELTRTRNREHAKSTRIRKKARYQELLDTELKYIELQNMEGLESKRRETVIGFLDARLEMLRSTVNSTSKHSSKQVSPETQKPTKESNESRAISFDQAESKPSAVGEVTPSPKGGLKTDDSGKSLEDFLEDENSFGFETSLGDIHAIDASAMIRLDENVAKRMEQMFGSDATSCRIDYRVLGSYGGIAMNKDGTGFARIEHVVAINPKNDAAGSHEAAGSGTTAGDEKLLLSSLVSFEFMKDSYLLKSVAWCILKDGVGTSCQESVNGSKSDATAKESLESQTVYPSVVSFDESHRVKAKGKSADATPPGQQEPVDQNLENPGMSI